MYIPDTGNDVNLFFHSTLPYVPDTGDAVILNFTTAPQTETDLSLTWFFLA